jgi:hypothetical protein
MNIFYIHMHHGQGQMLCYNLTHRKWKTYLQKFLTLAVFVRLNCYFTVNS